MMGTGGTKHLKCPRSQSSLFRMVENVHFIHLICISNIFNLVSCYYAPGSCSVRVHNGNHFKKSFAMGNWNVPFQVVPPCFSLSSSIWCLMNTSQCITATFPSLQQRKCLCQACRGMVVRLGARTKLLHIQVPRRTGGIILKSVKKVEEKIIKAL
jgi:hypothetical protein